MSELPLKGTLKAGGGFDAPWLTVDGADPNDLDFKLKSIIEHPTLAQNLIEAANLLKAVNNVAPLTQPPAEAPAQSAPAPTWGTSTAPTQAAPQAPAQQGGYQPHPSAVLHPEGKKCDLCSQPLEFKKSQGGKGKWQCGQWRWGNGNPNGHGMIWAD